MAVFPSRRKHLIIDRVRTTCILYGTTIGLKVLVMQRVEQVIQNIPCTPLVLPPSLDHCE